MRRKISIDNYDLDEAFNIISVRGSYNELTKMPNLKKPSTVNFEDEDFEDVYLKNRKISPSEISLTFLISSDSAIDLFRKRDAFFNLLKKNGRRTIYIASIKRNFYVYYLSCDNCKYYNSGKFRLLLKLKFKLIGQNEYTNTPTWIGEYTNPN